MSEGRMAEKRGWGKADELDDLAGDLAVLVDVELHELDLPGLGGIDDLVERA